MERPVVLIMAGGKGERFWPRSRESHPKQLQKVYSEKTLLQETIDRALTFTDRNRIFIGCNANLKKAVLETHDFPENQFVVEPEGRNTAPIIALAALQFESRFPGAVHAVLSADHFISPPEEFRNTALLAVEVAAKGYLVTLGVKPGRPETGYGYIAAGSPMEDRKSFCIDSFVEKPDLKTAAAYLATGKHFWNSGIFFWKGSVILEEFKKHAPEIINPLLEGNLEEVFRTLPKEPVDKAILEKSSKLAMIPASFVWDDVGSWNSLERILKADENNNISVFPSTVIASRDATNNTILSSKKMVALLGVKDLILVEEEDLIFIAGKSSTDSIKEFLADMKKKPSLENYLK